MNKKLLLLPVLVAGLATVSVFAYQGNPGIENPNPVDPVRHESMEKAFETKDYATWKTLMAGKGVLNKITTEAQFLTFVEMKAAFEKWDTATAQKLQTELSVWQKKMDGTGQKKWMGKWMKGWMWNRANCIHK